MIRVGKWPPRLGAIASAIGKGTPARSVGAPRLRFGGPQGRREEVHWEMERELDSLDGGSDWSTSEGLTRGGKGCAGGEDPFATTWAAEILWCGIWAFK